MSDGPVVVRRSSMDRSREIAGLAKKIAVYAVEANDTGLASTIVSALSYALATASLTCNIPVEQLVELVRGHRADAEANRAIRDAGGEFPTPVGQA